MQVHYVETVKDCENFLRWLGERRPESTIAIDTETTGLQWWTPQFLRMVQFGDSEQGWSIPFKWWAGVIKQAMAYIVKADMRVVMHNAKFDMHALESAGLPLPDWRRVEDTLVLDHLLDSSKPHSLKPIAARLFGQEALAGQAMLKQDMQKHGWTWATIPENHQTYWAYAAMDTVLTHRVWAQHEGPVKRLYLPAYEREMTVMAVLYGAENRGMRIDPVYTEGLWDEWYLEMKVVEEKLNAYGIKNPNANKQIEAALRLADPEWHPDEWTASGEAKMDKDVLGKLDSEIGGLVLRYRRLRKWSKAYLGAFLDQRDSGDRLHPTIRTLGARTGRMSITEPPLQTLPRGASIRNCVIPADGHSLLSIDYDTMEYRVFAAYAGAEIIQQAIKDGIDLHILTASLAYGIPGDQVTKSQRQISKNTAYGRIYGAGPAKIAVTASAPDTNGQFTLVTEQEVANFLEQFDAKVPEVSTFMRTVEDIAKNRLREEGQAYINSSGGRRIPGDPDRLYALVNYLVQGSCADVFKQKIVEIANAGLDHHIILPVHDELIFEVPKDEFNDLAPELERIMKDETTFSVPLTVGASGPLERWGDK